MEINNNEQWDLNKLSMIVVFILSALWRNKDEMLWKFPGWERLTVAQ